MVQLERLDLVLHVFAFLFIAGELSFRSFFKHGQFEAELAFGVAKTVTLFFKRLELLLVVLHHFFLQRLVLLIHFKRLFPVLC